MYSEKEPLCPAIWVRQLRGRDSKINLYKKFAQIWLPFLKNRRRKGETGGCEGRREEEKRVEIEERWRRERAREREREDPKT